MLMLKKLTALAIGALLSGSVIASQSDAGDPLISALNSDPKLKLQEFFSPAENAEWMANLPATPGLIVTKIKSGQYMIIDGSLRFAFYANNIFDILRGKEITSPEDINDVWLINTDNILKLSLPIFTYGKEKLSADITIMMPMEVSKTTKNIVAFIDEHKEEYRIDVMLMGTKSKEQLLSASNLYCAQDRKLAKQYLLDLKIPIRSDKATWLEQHVTCNAKDVLGAMQVARMYNVNHYPFVYNGYGASKIGLPKDLAEFSKSQPKDLATPQQLNWEAFKK